MKFTVSGTNTEFLESKVIEAKTRSEAEDKYLEMFNDGEILVVQNEVVAN